jgi:hypothetical protein
MEWLPNHVRQTQVTVTTLGSREFNQDASGARKAARHGPVFITDRDRPAYVPLTIEPASPNRPTSADVPAR